MFLTRRIGSNYHSYVTKWFCSGSPIFFGDTVKHLQEQSNFIIHFLFKMNASINLIISNDNNRCVFYFSFNFPINKPTCNTTKIIIIDVIKAIFMFYIWLYFPLLYFFIGIYNFIIIMALKICILFFLYHLAFSIQA